MVGAVSYGYPTDMVWMSYGEGTMLARKRPVNDS